MILKITLINISTIFLILLLSSFVFNGECRELVDKKVENFVSIFPGFFIDVDDDAVKIKFNIQELFTGRSLTSKEDAGSGNNNSGENKKPKVLQRIVGLLMMVPLMMQILALPGALASIKMSLLKSLIMGKMSIIIMLYCLVQHLRSSSNVVVVHKPPPPQHYDHYYSSFDDDEGWFG